MPKKLEDFIPSNEKKTEDNTSGWDYVWILADELRRTKLQNIIQFFVIIIFIHHIVQTERHKEILHPLFCRSDIAIKLDAR